jgi:hypothetical protein
VSLYVVYCYFFQVTSFGSPIDLKDAEGNIIILKIEPENDQLPLTIRNVEIRACFEPIGK